MFQGKANVVEEMRSRSLKKNYREMSVAEKRRLRVAETIKFCRENQV